MTRSSTKELLTPFKDPEREFRSSMKLFKTLSLDESRLPLDLFSDLEENSEEEVAKTMVETMEQYMIKTRADYGSSIARPKIDDKDHFELKGQFLKKLCDITFSNSDHEDANKHIKKVLKIVDLFHEVILFYNGLDVSTRQILDSKGVIPTKTAADTKVAIQEMAEYSQNGTMEYLGQEVLKLLTDWLQFKHNSTILEEKSRRAAAMRFYQRNNANPSYQERIQLMEESLSKFMNESAKRHEENSNLIKEIRASTDAAIRNQGASIKTLEIQIGQMSKVLQERGFGSVPSSIETNPRDHVKLISTTIEADITLIRRIESS
ncbi:hypothetical protein Tco_1238255 [Tanacetum coccineum]